MSRRQKLTCKVCFKPAIITKSEKIHPELYRLYCRCTNPDCRHEFAMSLEYSYTTKASRLAENGLLQYLLEKLPLVELEKFKTVLDKQLDKQLSNG